MKALSVRQPWANMIAVGLKKIEVRTWRTKYRGNILICASKIIDIGAARVLDHLVGIEPTGFALCTGELVDCRPMVQGDECDSYCQHTPRMFAWVFKDVCQIGQFPVKGQLGIFNVDYGGD